MIVFIYLTLVLFIKAARTYRGQFIYFFGWILSSLM